MALLANELTTNPGGLLQKVAELAMTLCRADSAGISILENGERELFRWQAIAGSFAHNLFGTIRRETSPCGVVISRDEVLLFDRPDRFFPALREVSPPIYEALLSPWHSNGKAIGTLWIFAHTHERRFDAEDARIVQSLAAFASAAHQMILGLAEARAEQLDLKLRIKESAYILSEAFRILRKEMAVREQAEADRDLAEEALRENRKPDAAGLDQSQIAHAINEQIEMISNLLYEAEYAGSLPEARRLLARAQIELVRARRKAAGSSKLKRHRRQAADSGSGEATQLDNSASAPPAFGKSDGKEQSGKDG